MRPRVSAKLLALLVGLQAERGKPFELSASQVLRMRGCTPLLLAPEAIGKSVSLRAKPIDGAGLVVSPRGGTAMRDVTKPGSTGVSDAERGAYVGIVEVMGPLEQRASEHMCGYSDGYDAITARFASMLSDERVGSVVLRIDSGGGDAAGCFEAVRRMRALAEDAGKPVLAFADEFAASAAYAIASVAEQIYLPPTGGVGSVGAISVHSDESRALDQEGVTLTVIRSGARKAEFSNLEPLSDSARDHLVEHNAELGARFCELIAESRGGTGATWQAHEAAVFWGEDAVAKGFADGLASFEDVVSMAAEAAEEKRNAMGFKEMNAALGLPEDAPLAASLEAILARNSALAFQAGMLTLTGTQSAAAAHGAVTALQDKAARTSELEAKLLATEAAASGAKMAADLDAAIEAGRVPPAKRAQLLEGASQHGPEWLSSALSVFDAPMVPMRGKSPRDPAPPNDGANGDEYDSEMDEESKKLLKAFKISAKEFGDLQRQMKAQEAGR